LARQPDRGWTIKPLSLALADPARLVSGDVLELREIGSKTILLTAKIKSRITVRATLVRGLGELRRGSVAGSDHTSV
jgi:hypothetical protein